jgi:hypothetical protein
MKKIGSAVVLLIVVAACGSSEPPPKSVANAERPSCASHADCALTTFSGCCSCCEGAPRAMMKTELDRQQGQCHAVECDACKADLEMPQARAPRFVQRPLQSRDVRHREEEDAELTSSLTARK